MTSSELWWRILWSELPSKESKASAPEDRRLARRRVRAVRELFFSLAETDGIDVLIEVGAHLAEASTRFVAVSEDRIALAYEPNPVVIQQLSGSNLSPRIKVIPKAIGERSGEVSFLVPRNAKMAVWASLNERVYRPVEVDEIPVSMSTIDLEVARMFEWEPSAQGPRSMALWIDVEGSELDVLRGAETALSERVALAYIEVTDNPAYLGGVDGCEVIQLLLDMNFVPVARDNQFNRAFNVLFAHQSLFEEQRTLIHSWIKRQSRGSAVRDHDVDW
jgi:FkbM family methyltransferase